MPVPVRFADMDMFRHLNNVAAGQFYEEGRFAILAEANARVPREERRSLVVASVHTTFLGTARYPGKIDVCTGIVEVGIKSFVIGQSLFVEQRCIGTADTTVVATDPDGACPLPAVLVVYLQTLLITP
ncbi:thioesterase family protein [Novosphingobium sp. Gsoil 351]|uniref:acyl-CoA thioesterase n=1 Tax=Novosphingobium sp. Gsoil 351 TaxID=2675225 RepID=UPI0018A861B6|nr:acyl-CoA thioesterase [Novosphingobium sp. Gsoil 351]